MTFTIDAKEARMFADLRKLNLRHPGMVNARVTKLIRLNTLSYQQLQAVRLEWLRLCPPAPAAESQAKDRT